MLIEAKDADSNSQMAGSQLALAGSAPQAPPPPPYARVRRSISLRRALLVVFSRRRLIAVVAAVVVLLTLATIFFLPARYRSEAKLLVRSGGKSVVIDSAARMGHATALEGRDKEINSEIELLKSRKLTEAVVTAVGPSRILGRKGDAPASAKDTADAIARVEEKVTVEGIADSDVLSISFESDDPALSRDVVAQLIDAFLDQRARVYGDQGELKFFQGQSDSARRQQAQAQRKLRELRDSSGVANAQEQRTLLLKRVDSIQHDIDAARADLAAVVNTIDALSRQIAEMPATPVIEAGGGAVSDALDRARMRLLELRQQEIDMASRYRDDARPLRIIRQRIARAEQELTAMVSEELNQRRAGEMATQSSLQSRIQALEAAKVSAQSGLAWIDEVGMKTQTLEQEEALAASNVAKYAQACEQARIDSQIGQQRIGISVAEAPVLPLRPRGPARSLLVLAGLFLAMSLGLGSAFVANAFDHTIRHVEHLHALGLGQVVSIPYVNDYYEPYSHALHPPRQVALTQGVSRPPGNADADDDADPTTEPMRPLRALIRSSADPSATGARAPADRGIGDMDLSSGATLMITEEGGTASIFVRPMGNTNRPAGQLAVSARILAAIRSAVDHLIPLDGQAAPRVIGVVSASNGQGASTTALHLAIALANRIATGLDQPSAFNRVLLLDSDVESPTSTLLAGAALARGLGDWVGMRTADVQPLTELITPTRQYLLDLLPAGAPRERSSLGPRMPLVMQAMAQRYRQVVVDLPSVMDSDASVQFAGLCDTVVFVCQANELRFEAAQQTLRRLRDAGAKVSLAVLNKRRYPVPEWAYRLS